MSEFKKYMNELPEDKKEALGSSRNATELVMNEIYSDEELLMEELNMVSGGNGEQGAVTAFCKCCGTKMYSNETRRIAGGLTNIFKCTNKKCNDYGKEKNNLEVRWK